MFYNRAGMGNEIQTVVVKAERREAKQDIGYGVCVERVANGSPSSREWQRS